MSLPLSTYIKQLVAIYQTNFAVFRLKQEKPIYRIVSLPTESNKNIHFHVIGTSAVLRKPPEEIMRDDLLLGFNRAEIAIITHLGTKNESVAHRGDIHSSFKILKQSLKENKTMFVIEKDTGELVECEASDLCKDTSMVNNFSGIDGMKIGYTASEEYHRKTDVLKSD